MQWPPSKKANNEEMTKTHSTGGKKLTFDLHMHAVHLYSVPTLHAHMHAYRYTHVHTYTHIVTIDLNM